MEMDMSNTMEELDAMAKGLKNLSIRTKSDKESSKAKQSQQFLQEAHGIVYGDRHEEYGDAANNFDDIARMWTDWNKGWKFTKEDVAMMMIMVKIARCHQNWTEDSLKDIVGYCTILHRFKFIDD
tara:strand:+ start:379 stop:753 length:375 start_codon:yes stop_codon:yes gene_type:complete